MLTPQDLLDLRRMNNIPDAQRFLAQKGIAPEEWDPYLVLVGKSYQPDTEVKLVVRDPMRHWTWAMLYINGCSYRMIAEYYGVQHASVYEAVKRHIKKQHRPLPRLRDKSSLEYMSAMIAVVANDPGHFKRMDLLADAELLNNLATALGD